MRITIHPDDSFNGLLGEIEKEFHHQGVDPDSANDCYAIIDEIHANMRHHVAPGETGFSWTMNLMISNNRLIMAFEYLGPCFDPTKPDTISSQSIEDRDVGGLGLAIVSALSDDIQYSYKNGKNTLTVYKTFTNISRENGSCP